MHKPKLLILDEPFSGFDPINTELIKNEILRMKNEGTTIIFSTHNMGSVEEMCDHIALINNSKKILDGSVRDIKKEYRTNEYEIEFNGNMIGFTNSLWTCAELLDKQQLDENTHKAKVKLVGNNSVNSMLQNLMGGVEIRGLKEIVPSMNDIFINVVTKKNEEHG